MKTNLAVIFGGRSVEHEISVISAMQAIAAADKNKYNIVPVYIAKNGHWFTGEKLVDIENYRDMPALSKSLVQIFINSHTNEFAICKKTLFGLKMLFQIDVVLPVLHGANGEDGAVQGLLELKNIPYVGSDILGSALGMDKIIMKMVLRECGLPVVDYVWFTDKDWLSNNDAWLKRIGQLGYPVIIKPANLGSSIGISKASNRDELLAAVALAGNFSKRILVERMIMNLQEINCSVIGDSDRQSASVCEEPHRTGDILSFDDKYTSDGGKNKGMGGARRQIPANIPPALAATVQDLAKKTFSVLNCNGVARIDFLINRDDNRVCVNEINTIPGSLSFYLWQAGGRDFTWLVDELVGLAYKRHRDKSTIVVENEIDILKRQSPFSMGKGK
jgi:D-alanine-D-alanine ligase